MKKKYFLIGFVAFLLIIQLFRIDKTNPTVDIKKDFIAISNPPQEIASIIKTSCYDCHSNESVYPWYANVAPVSWYLKNHIIEARNRVNFSEWADYRPDKAKRKLEACAEDIEEGYMPLSSYTLMHSNAKISSEQAKLVGQWFKDLSQNTVSQ